MKTNETFIRDICLGFQQLRGKASAYCFPPFKFEEVLYNMICLYRRKHTEEQILIVLDNVGMRYQIAGYLVNNHIDISHIKMLSKDYINRSNLYASGFTILVNIFDIITIKQLEHSSTFTFALFTKNIMDNEFIISVRSLLPEIKVTVDNNSAFAERINKPVEEVRISVELDNDERAEYDKASNFIKDSIAIFGSLDDANKCRIGDTNNNISATDYRYQLAYRNGWSSELDCTSDFNKKIDEIYNPNQLAERANLIYNIIRTRNDLVLNCKSKLDAICDIIDKNRSKKILIVTKSGTFANEIGKYITNNIGITAGYYHDSIESQYMIDETGETIKYKSGEKKGQPKLFGSVSISTYCLDRFKNGTMNILVSKFNLDKNIDIKVDLIIFTTPLYDTYEEFLAKHIKLEVADNIRIYKLYCNNTNEYTTLNAKPIKSNVTIIEEEKNIEIEENTGNIVL